MKRISDKFSIRQHFLLAFVPALALSTACGGSNQEQATGPALRPVRYVVASEASTGRVRTLSGTSRAGQEARLSFDVGGTVQAIHVKVGDRLRPGQVIARLDPRNYELELQKTRASLIQVEADERNARAAYLRVRNLYESANASRSELDSRRAAAESSDALVASALRSLEIAQLNLADTELTTADPCLVASVEIEVRENVQAGQTVVDVVCGDVNEVLLAVPESLITDLEKGMQVEIHFNAIPRVDFTGEVAEVGVTSTEGATFAVVLKVKESHRHLRSGLAAEVTFHFTGGTTPTGVIILPPVAVGQDSQGRFVFSVGQTNEPGVGIIHRRPVVVGDVTAAGLEIIDGVSAGDKIVTAGVSMIHDGMRVRLDSEPRDPAVNPPRSENREEVRDVASEGRSRSLSTSRTYGIADCASFAICSRVRVSGRTSRATIENSIPPVA